MNYSWEQFRLDLARNRRDQGMEQDWKKFRSKYGWICDRCKDISHDYYMVHNSTWFEVAHTFQNLHLGCLEYVLGRDLDLADFPLYPINEDIKEQYESALGKSLFTDVTKKAFALGRNYE